VRAFISRCFAPQWCTRNLRPVAAEEAVVAGAAVVDEAAADEARKTPKPRHRSR
jgi:hypothetical protein